MKSQGLYKLFGMVLVMSGVIVWLSWGSITTQGVIAPTEIASTDPQDHTTENGHHDENLIRLSDAQIKNLGIPTRLAGPGQLSVNISTRGKIILHPDKWAHILPKISGVAKEARKNIGDPVSEGEVLAVLESREMADIKANYLAANEKASLAFSLLERERGLREKKISPEQDYLNAKSAYAEAKIDIQLSEQKLHALGIDNAEIKRLSNANDPELRVYDIRSPLNGTVIARHITRGEFIENTTTIYEVADLSTVWVEIGIYPKDLARVKEGQMVDISLPVDGQTSQAKIIYLSPIIQDETITAKAIAEMENPKGIWRPGSFVKVNIATAKVSAPVVVPKEAVQEINGKDFVFVRTPHGFEKRQAQIGVSGNDHLDVISGLSPGEEYAASKTFLLKADLSKKEAEHDH